jgi:hypothetical protein
MYKFQPKMYAQEKFRYYSNNITIRALISIFELIHASQYDRLENKISTIMHCELHYFSPYNCYPDDGEQPTHVVLMTHTINILVWLLMARTLSEANKMLVHCSYIIQGCKNHRI